MHRQKAFGKALGHHHHQSSVLYAFGSLYSRKIAMCDQDGNQNKSS